MPEEFHLPVDDILKNVPGLLRGEAKKLLLKIDTLDLSHDGKRDVAQLAHAASILFPFFALANEAIDFEKLGEFICAQPFVKDKAKMAEAIKIVCAAIEKA